MYRGLLWLSAGLTVALLASGCGGGGVTNTGTPLYLPLAVGNVWRYTATEYTAGATVRAAQRGTLLRRARGLLLRPTQVGTAQVVGEQIVTITGTKKIGGATWFASVGYYVGEAPGEPVYVRHDSQGLMFRNDEFDPGYYLLRNPVATGNTWADPFDARYRLTITGTGQSIGVEEGVFQGCVSVQETFTPTSGPVAITTDWYAPGVGLVREEYQEDGVLQYQQELKAHTLVE